MIENSKPISKKAFNQVLESYLEGMYHKTTRFSASTLIAIQMMNVDALPDVDMEEEDEDEFLDDLHSVYDWTTTDEGLKDYLSNRYEEDDDNFFSIGDSDCCDYKNIKEFLDDLDYEFVRDTLKKCWERSCTSGELFPEEEFLNDYRKKQDLILEDIFPDDENGEELVQEIVDNLFPSKD